MTPAPSAGRRLPPFGCADGGATTETATATQPKAQVKAAKPATEPCPAKVGVLVDSLDRLRRQLAIGLSYEQYAAKVKALRASYDQIPIENLTIGCLAKSGTPAEDALNRYIDAANAWGECLADASCTTAAIEPVLQRRWRRASGSLSKAPVGQ